jgi:Xaa-Pro dipeptidase
MGTMSRREVLGVLGGLPLAAAACARGRSAAGPAAAGTGPPAPTGSGAARRFPELAGFCDGVAPIGADECAARQERARKLLRVAGFAALVVEAGPTMRYFAGDPWRRSERPLLLVLPVSGQPVFVGPAFEEGTLRESVVGGGAELRVWQEHEDPYALAVAALRDRGARRGRVALEPTTRLFISTGLARAGSGIAFDAGAAVVDACRMVKSAAELALLRRANQATKAALRAASARAAAGMTEDELAGLVREAQEAAGLDSVWTLALFGPDAAFPHGTRNRRRLADGDLILVDTGGDLHGYQSDITRTWAFGAVAPESRRAFDAVLAAQEAAMARIRPGARCGDVDAAARRVVAERGFGGDYQRFTHRLGHGIGLEGHEAPYLVRGSETRLVPGMTMSNEPGIYLAGRFGVRIEDIAAVTEEGVEVFGPRVRSLEAPFGDGPDRAV